MSADGSSRTDRGGRERKKGRENKNGPRKHTPDNGVRKRTDRRSRDSPGIRAKRILYTYVRRMYFVAHTDRDIYIYA